MIYHLDQYLVIRQQHQIFGTKDHYKDPVTSLECLKAGLAAPLYRENHLHKS